MSQSSQKKMPNSQQRHPPGSAMASQDAPGQQHTKPLFKLNDLVEQINSLFPNEKVTKADISDPKPFKIQQIYRAGIYYLFGDEVDLGRIPEFSLGQISSPEMLGNVSNEVMLGMLKGMFGHLHPRLGFEEMGLMDLYAPKKQRTLRFLGNFLNLLTFYRERYEHVEQVCEDMGARAGEVVQATAISADLQTEINNVLMQTEEMKNEAVKMRRQLGDVETVNKRKEDAKIVVQGDLKQVKNQKAKMERKLEKLDVAIQNEEKTKQSLEDQCVSSPDRLRAELRALEKELAAKKKANNLKAKEAGQLTDEVKRMKNSLAKMKQAVELVCKAGEVAKNAGVAKEEAQRQHQELLNMDKATVDAEEKLVAEGQEKDKISNWMADFRSESEKEIETLNRKLVLIEKNYTNPLNAKLKDCNDELQKVEEFTAESTENLKKYFQEFLDMDKDLEMWLVSYETQYLASLEDMKRDIDRATKEIDERALSFMALKKDQ